MGSRTPDAALEACTIRAAVEDDAARLERFYERLSEESRYLRFFSCAPDAHQRRSSLSDPSSRLVLLAEHADEIVGTAELVPYGRAGTDAEVAFAVLDAWQHHGLATRMLCVLAAAARARRICTFTAQVLGANTRMMQVFRESGLPMTERLEGGVYQVTLRLDRDLEQAPSASGTERG